MIAVEHGHEEAFGPSAGVAVVSGWGLRARILGEEPEEAVEAWLCAMTAQMMI